MENIIIKKIDTLFKQIQKGTKKPKDTNVGFCLNKLLEINPELHKDYMNTYKFLLMKK
jgi:hypothetical protein